VTHISGLEDVIYHRFLLAPEDNAKMLCMTLRQYLVTDIPGLLGKISESFNLSDMSYVDKKKYMPNDERVNIKTNMMASKEFELLRSFSPNTNKNVVAIVDAARYAINVCCRQLQNLQFASKGREFTHNIYLYVYILLRTFLIIIAKVGNAQNPAEMSNTDLLIYCHNIQGNNHLLLMFDCFMEKLNTRYNVSFDLHSRSIEVYERQREDIKQETLRKMEQLDKEGKLLFKSLKSRGLTVDILDTKDSKENTSPSFDDEVEKAIANDQGENADYEDEE
jgi:hypothetical protein